MFQPANILVCEEDGDVLFKIGDVGISTSCSASGGRTMAGTLTYMAPEIKSGDSYTTKVDVFSFGITLVDVVFTALCRWASCVSVSFVASPEVVHVPSCVCVTMLCRVCDACLFILGV